jgi:hypothetical protein
MATNPYFKYGVRSEQNMFEDITIEALQMYGQDVYYLPREIVNKDTVFLDDVPSRFSSSYKVEMYIENAEGFGGEGDLFTKFGVELRDQATFVVARKRWQQLIGSKLTEKNFRPREGDLIYLPLSQSIFQIERVETETPFYQLEQLPTFRMTCELFEYSDEDFDTNIRSIDVVEAEGAFQYKLTLDSAGGGYTIGETVIQEFADYNMKGEVTFWSDSGNELRLAHVGATDGNFHEFTTNALVVGQTSNGLATPTLVEQLQEIQEDAQNAIFDSFESDFLDFSESNPFGDIE